MKQVFILISIGLVDCPLPWPDSLRRAGGGAAHTDAHPKAVVQPTPAGGGLRCSWAGGGATLTFGGKRLNFTCGAQGGEQVGLIGNVSTGNQGWEIEKAVYARGSGDWLLKSSAQQQITHIDLADGARCAWAGRGATLSSTASALTSRAASRVRMRLD